MTLKQEVLDKLARELGMMNWEHYKNYGHPPRKLDDWQELELAVELTLKAVEERK